MSEILGVFARPLAAFLAIIFEYTNSYAGAIILLTLAVMIVVLPLTLKGTRSMLAMQKLQPEMKKLQDLHKDDRLKLNQEMQALYKHHNINPLGGCFPLLVQIPIFIVLYEVIQGLTRKTGSGVNRVVSPEYLDSDTRLYRSLVEDGGQMLSFGVDFAKKATSPHASVLEALPFYALILAMVLVQYWSVHQTLKRSISSNNNPQAQTLIKVQKFFPLVFGVIAFNFVAGLVLYWFVSALFRVGQTAAIYRFDPQLRNTVAAAKKESAELISRGTTRGRSQKGVTKASSSSSKNKKKRKGR